LTIHALAAPSLAPAPFVAAAATAPRGSSPADVAKTAAKLPAAQNDADGDLKADLASGENPYETLGSKVNIKA
jgi:hypothetical protein